MRVDTLIQDAWVYQTVRRIFEKKQVYLLNGKIYYVASKLDDTLIPQNTIQAENQYLIPGLIDIHMHIESSMTTPEIFSQTVLPYGVTTVVADAHEMANVFGIEGLRAFFDCDTTLDIFQAIPSSVPSTKPELETTGGQIGLSEVAELLTWPKMICLGEAMDFKGIAYEKESLIRKIIDLCRQTKPTMPIEGHIPKIYKRELADFLASGITSDHTHQFAEHLIEKMEAGLFIELQEKSLTKEVVECLNDYQLMDHACVVTDDVMADRLQTGHLNQLVQLLIKLGMRVEDAIYMATFTPARRMQFSDRGRIAPGMIADLILLNSIDDWQVTQVIKSGQSVYSDNQVSVPLIQQQFPEHFYRSLQCRPLTKEDCQIKVKTDKNHVRCRVVEREAIGTFTLLSTQTFLVKDTQLQLDSENYCYLFVQERYTHSNRLAKQIIKQKFTTKGCIATTWAHDHHNILLMGNDSESIVCAQKRLLELQGGYVVVKEGKVVAECPLPIGGIVSQEPIVTLGAKLGAVRTAMNDLGYTHTNEIMSFSTLSLPVSPAYKVTDRGLLETKTQQFLAVVLEEDGVILDEESIDLQ